MRSWTVDRLCRIANCRVGTPLAERESGHLLEAHADEVQVAGGPSGVEPCLGERGGVWVGEIDRRAGAKHPAQRDAPFVVGRLERGERLMAGSGRRFEVTQRPLRDGKRVEPAADDDIVA